MPAGNEVCCRPPVPLWVLLGLSVLGCVCLSSCPAAPCRWAGRRQGDLGHVFGSTFLAGEWANTASPEPGGAPCFAGVSALPAPWLPRLLQPRSCQLGEVSREPCHPSAMWKMSPSISSDTVWGGEARLLGAVLCCSPSPGAPRPLPHQSPVPTGTRPAQGVPPGLGSL